MSNFFSVENFQMTKRGLDFGIPGEPYSQYNYIDLIEECKTKDKELFSLRKIVNGAKYEQMRQELLRKELQGDPRLRRRHEQELKIGPLATIKKWQLGPPRLIISGYKPPSTIGLEITKMSMPISWPKRSVVIVSYDLSTSVYRVSTTKATYLLTNASTELNGEESLGLEIELEAYCDLIYLGTTAKPSICLRYKNHQVHYQQDNNIEINNVVGRVGVLLHRRRRTKEGILTQVWLVREKYNDFEDWKFVLRAYLIECTTFPQFAPEKERTRIRTKINTMRNELLNASKWNLSSWNYEKLMIVYEGEGWSLNSKPFTVIDGIMLMNLSQEASKAMSLISKMARVEIESRMEGFDTPKRKRLRERWTVPTGDVNVPIRPYEVVSNSKTNEMNVNMESSCQSCQRLLNESISFDNDVDASDERGGANGERVEMISYRETSKRKQTSHVYLVSCDDDDKRNPTLKKLGDEYAEGRWFDVSQSFTNIDATSPFRKLLDIGNESDWRQMYIKLRNYRPPSTLPSSSLTTPTFSRNGQKQKSKPPLTSPLTIERKVKRNMARSQSMQPLRDLKDTFQYATVPDTPIQKIRVPKGGWLQSETRRRTGPGSNDPKVTQEIALAKLKRKNERKKARKNRKREKRNRALEARRKQVMEEGFLPEI